MVPLTEMRNREENHGRGEGGEWRGLGWLS